MKRYKGNREAFIYGLFADADREKALEVLQLLENRGKMVSCDSRSAMLKASLVIVFLSKNILKDQKALEEISLLFKENRNVFAVFLEEVSLNPGLAMLFGQIQGIQKYRLSDEEFEKELTGAPVINELKITGRQIKAARRNTIAVIILTVLVITGITAGFLVGFFDRVDKNSLLGKLGLSGGLNGIEKVYVYGEELYDEHVYSYIIEMNSHDYRTLIVDDHEHDFGHIDNLTDFAQLKNLEELCISGNDIESIEPILSLKKLKMLDLTGNPINNINGISQLSSLETLNLSNTNVSDYDELLKSESLKTLYVSGEQYDQASALESRRFDVETEDAIVDTYAELKEALNDDDAKVVTIRNSIYVPEGETVTIGKNVDVCGHGFDGAVEGEGLVFENNGTIIIEGCFGLGLCTRRNNGSIIVKENGAYSGGMCDSENNGRFTIETGGVLRLERNHTFINNGELLNEGKVFLKESARIYHNGGRFDNHGEIYFWDIWYGGIQMNAGGSLAAGKCYVYENDAYKEVSAAEMLSHNHF